MNRIRECLVRQRSALPGRRRVLGWLGAMVVAPWALGAQGKEPGAQLLGALERAGASGQVDSVRLWGQWILRREDLRLIEPLTAGHP